MLKRLIVMSSLLFVLAAGAAAVSAQEWHNLGSKEVKDRSEQDTWHLGVGKGQFRKLKIAVIYRAVKFYRLRITYGNGETQEVAVRTNIPAGGETRAIDLTGKDRYIDKVDVWYEANTRRRGVRSMVTLWGLK